MNTTIASTHSATATLESGDPLGSPCATTYERLRDALHRASVSPSADWERIYLAMGALGIGVFAKVPLSAGDLIIELCGEPMSFAQAVALGDWQCYALQVGLDQEYINTSEPGRFVNHSCTPNAGLRGLRLFALQTIGIGEEIRFDYSTTMAEDYWEMPCRCGSPQCRGRIRDFRHLPMEVKRSYRDLGIVAAFIP